MFGANAPHRREVTGRKDAAAGDNHPLIARRKVVGARAARRRGHRASLWDLTAERTALESERWKAEQARRARIEAAEERLQREELRRLNEAANGESL
ncbi:MAG: hypothetical protein ACI9MR_004157 [Myxococcota bacterium]